MIFIRLYCIECGTFSQESSMLYCYTAWKHSHLWFTHYHSGYNNPANPPNPMNYHSCFFLKNNIPATSCMSSFMDSDLEMVSAMCWFPRCVTIQMIGREKAGSRFCLTSRNGDCRFRLTKRDWFWGHGYD